MSAHIETEEYKKAKFYYESIDKFDKVVRNSYKRLNSKVDIFIGILTTVIPILTGIGAIIVTNVVSYLFFAFYVVSLIVFIITLAKCVHLLSPRIFEYVDTVKIMQEFDEDPLDFNIFKVASTWNDTIRENLAKINLLHADLKQVVILILVGLGFLVAAFVLLGIDYYLML